MKILIFEDSVEVRDWIKEYLDDTSKYELTICRTWSAVTQKLETGLFDCYIVDLNAPTTGLSDKIEKKTRGGLLTGWFLLTEHIWKSDLNGITKTIIFSGYNEQLKNYVDSEEASEEEKRKFRQLEKYKCVVTKGDGMEELDNAITSINQRNG
jgi:CheY-like chemotaxis protein